MCQMSYQVGIGIDLLDNSSQNVVSSETRQENGGYLDYCQIAFSYNLPLEKV